MVACYTSGQESTASSPAAVSTSACAVAPRYPEVAMSPVPVSSRCPITVILLRHAERASTPANDPPLTPAGEARARDLAGAVGTARVSAIFTTQFRRSVQTAQPLADQLSLTPVVLTVDPANDNPTSPRKRIRQAVRHRSAQTVRQGPRGAGQVWFAVRRMRTTGLTRFAGFVRG